MSELAPLPDEMPSLEKVILPARAFLLSWKNQTVPARSAAIADSLDYARSLEGDADPAVRDMALLSVIGEAVQPLEDLAYLGTAWDSPYRGIATYVRATTWKRFTATNFWQEAKKWDDDRIDVFAGFSGRDPDTQQIVSLVDGLRSLGVSISPDVAASMGAAQQATRDRLRRLLEALGSDWKQLSPYFLAYKHGGLAINRDDVVWVDDDVERVDDDTDRYEPSLAVWTRAGRADELKCDFNLRRDEIVDYAAGTGRLAVDLCEAFIESRLAVVDTIAFSDEGEPLGLKSLQVPWTIWLREQDLDRSHLERLGAGPRLTWVAAEPAGSER